MAEVWAAKRLHKLFPNAEPPVERRTTVSWGDSRSDLTDEGTPYCVEVKKRGGKNPWPAFLERALVQAQGYADLRVSPSIAMVMLVNSPGPGVPQEGRVYMAEDTWNEREEGRGELEVERNELRQEVAALTGQLTHLYSSASPLIPALVQILDNEATELERGDIQEFIDAFTTFTQHPERH